MGEFKTIETQEQLDTIIGERLKREREAVKKEYEGYLSPEDVTKKYEGYLSQDEIKEKYKNYLSPEEVAKKDLKIKQYETDSVKTRIAHESGLSYEAISFLGGDDEESIRQSAEALKSLVGGMAVAPLASTEPVVEDENTAALKNTLKRLKGE